MDGVGGDRKSGRSMALVGRSADSMHRPARKRSGAYGHVTQSRLLHPCQALSAQIGMSERIRVDNLFCAVLRDLEYLDRFVRAQ